MTISQNEALIRTTLEKHFEIQHERRYLGDENHSEALEWRLPGAVLVTTDGVSLTIKKNGRWLPTIWFDEKTNSAREACTQAMAILAK